MHFLIPNIFTANPSVGSLETVLGNTGANKSSPLEILKLKIWLCSTTEKVWENFQSDFLYYSLSKCVSRYIEVP